ncbi:hypothetical protein AVEN_267878-1 [Araneus ventricosus]|uniref:Uncharacterized protein n=1 Tax=Araneus ventricosus TaxID=182803 RepID=A0A4Y2HA12_ARAVE|nr:hypothetical protein AVEN_267878-1 [Araneus ventricosus]
MSIFEGVLKSKFQYIKDKIIDGPRSHNIQQERDFYGKTSEEDFSSFEEVTETSSDDEVDPDEALEGHSCESCGSVLSDAQLRSRRILSASDESYSSPPMSSSSSVATIHISTRDCSSHCTLCNMAGGTLAQASVIRFRSSCNVGGGFAYTRCLMYPRRKSPIGSGQVNVETILRNHHTR